MNEMKWVPGFIWVTGFSVSGREVDEKWPYLLAVSAIESVSELQDYQRTGLRCGCIALQTAEDTAGVRTVLETPEQIADLIRQEWENRISRDAEIRWASTRGERL